MVLIEVMLAVAFFTALFLFLILMNRTRNYKNSRQAAQSAIDGLTRIQEMLVEHDGNPDPRLCRVINDAINNWNTNFSADYGRSIPTLNCPP
jgi:hypothetical protein